MKTPFAITLMVMLAGTPVRAHSWKAEGMGREALRAHLLADWEAGQRKIQPGEWKSPRIAQAGSGGIVVAAAQAAAANAPVAARAFLSFPRVELKWDKDFLYVGSNGLPDHNMMVGITAWQQQVPLPQPYTGENAWRIPLNPVPAKQPAIIKGRFLRGAIALAVNGIPIFNPQNNRGEVSQEIGELDRWGGHCGRADDYHYHVAPLHLEAIVGKGKPVAYALDGYPVLGLTEPDGSPVGALDECHGHETKGAGYHYHAATKYPYVLGGFHGEVVEAEGQVDPQPRARGVREALQALRGAEITGFESTGANSYKLSYTVGGDKRSVAYSINADGTFPFEFDNGREGRTREVYTARQGGGGGGKGGKGGPEGQRGKGKGGKGGPGKGPRPDDNPPPPDDRRPPRPSSGASLMDRNGDGIVSASEFAEEAKRQFELGKSGGTLAEAMSKARADFNALDRNRDGQLDSAELAAQEPRRDDRPPPPVGRDEPERGGGARRAGGGGQTAAAASPDQPRSSSGTFLLTSPEVEDNAEMPADYTGDGSGATLPLEWKGAPAGTQSFALIMDHRDPQGEMKWYWTLYDIPANVTRLAKNTQGVGKMGTAFKGEVGYEPPHSKGPGPKTYVLTLYALSAPIQLNRSPGEVNRDVLLAAMKGKVLATSSLRVVHTSKGNDGPGGGSQTAGPRRGGGNDDPPRMASSPGGNGQPPPRPGSDSRPLDNIFAQNGAAGATSPQSPPPSEPRRPGGPDGKGKGKGKGGADNKGLIKPTMDDTVHVNVYADNWFAMFINGELVAVDSIKFTPHNVVSLDILPEYPMTIAILAKDNADPKTGLEYGDHIGDGGFVIKFSDGTVSNATWKAKSFFKGPLNHDTKNPRVDHTPIPDKWWMPDFDDSAWARATEYTEERVNPKEPYYKSDFAGAKFIWSDDLDLDNTVIFRTRIEKPGWTKRWNTKPDLDISGAPFK